MWRQASFRQKRTLQGVAGFGNLMAAVNVYDGLFEAYCDAKADDDGGDVDEEIAW